MPSFQDVRDVLLLSYDQELINDEEFLLLYEANKSNNLVLNHTDYEKFCLEDKIEDECKAEFRVEKRDFPLLMDALRIPAIFKCNQGTVCDGTEGLCILLRRFAYPCRYSDMVPMFGRSVPEIGMISNTVLDWFYATHGHRITQWNRDILDPVYLQIYADAVSNQGAALDNCFGFVDGTVRPICRPDRNQRIVYNGHKRVHALKFQSLALPNGLVGHLYGPIEGRRHDAGMLADSKLLDDLQQYAFSPTGQPMCIYGDPAYPLRIHLQAPFRNVALTPQMAAYNKSMSAVRVSVEWLFGDILNYFKFLD